MKANAIYVTTLHGKDYFSHAEYTVDDVFICVKEGTVKYYFPLCNVIHFVIHEEEL